MAYPTSRSETLADGLVHIAGLLMVFPAAGLLVLQAGVSPPTLWAATLYVVCLILSLSASALYHLSPFDGIRPFLRRVDHAAIYLKIAGTYAPFVALIGSAFAYAVLGLVWGLALAGAVAKMWFWQANGKGSLTLYLGMGWLAVLLIWPMWSQLPGAAVGLIVIGGMIYSAGTAIYAHPGMRYQNALWHAVVLLASACLFAAVALSVHHPL